MTLVGAWAAYVAVITLFLIAFALYLEAPPMNIAQYAKAIAAVVAGAVTQLIAGFGIDTAQSVEQAISVVLTALVVFLVPNKPAGE